jgi:hypothetical protein
LHERQRALRVVLGADLSRSRDVDMAKVAQLRELSSCDVTAVHLYWPPQHFERLSEAARPAKLLRPRPFAPQNLRAPGRFSANMCGGASGTRNAGRS